MSINIESLDSVLESLLFLSGNGLKILDIKETLSLQKTEINAAIKRLKEKYNDDCGIVLIEYNGTIQFGSNPKYKEAIESVLNPIRQKSLTAAVMETVAIIAYRQPITRLEIEHIRGVKCDYAMQILTDHKLVDVVGRKDAIGKPLLFGTTDEFLKRFRIESIDKLPDYDQLLESISVIEQARSGTEREGLYNEFELPPEEGVPEFLKDEEVIVVAGESGDDGDFSLDNDQVKTEE
ncbi:MAG: SMC-Scp complex subunit ScpB [Firmicutes bacterium]|nr:SMC-Scp complex subunit ScpB [Bacillota bacterium]